jgi:transketolase
MTTPALVSLRDAYGDNLLKLAADDERLVVLDADLAQSTRTARFKDLYPDRYLNVGIAEQNMVSMAAGIALGGGIPLVNTFASFLTRRAADQIAMSVAYTRLPVKLFGFHGGVNLGEDGASQQSVEDLGIMQAIPHIRVYVPLDAEDLADVMLEALGWDGPTYVRLARFPSPSSIGEHARDGSYAPVRLLREGDGPLILTTGTLGADVLATVEDIAAVTNTNPAVVGISRIKPIDPALLVYVTGRADRIAVIEEHNVHGGLAAAVATFLDENGVPHRLERIGVQDRFGESGEPRALLAHLGLGGALLMSHLQSWLAA